MDDEAARHDADLRERRIDVVRAEEDLAEARRVYDEDQCREPGGGAGP